MRIQAKATRITGYPEGGDCWAPSRNWALPDGRPARQGRHRRPHPLRQIASEHGRRLASFSIIGFGVFAAGLAMQVVLVQVIHTPKMPAYVMQLALSVQVNFLANYRWTWGDRDTSFWRSCWRYNIKRVGGVLISLGIYPWLIRLGMNYLTANALVVVGLTPANYLLGHFWTFASGRSEAPVHTPSESREPSYANTTDSPLG